MANEPAQGPPYESKEHGTEHYTKGQFDAFDEQGKRIPNVSAVTLRKKAVRQREEKKARRE